MGKLLQRLFNFILVLTLLITSFQMSTLALTDENENDESNVNDIYIKDLKEKTHF